MPGRRAFSSRCTRSSLLAIAMLASLGDWLRVAIPDRLRELLTFTNVME